MAVRRNFLGGGGQGSQKFSKITNARERSHRTRHEGPFAFLKLKMNDLVHTFSGFFVTILRPGHTARTLLERSLNGRERGQRSSPRTKWEQNRKLGRCLSGAPLKPALL